MYCLLQSISKLKPRIINYNLIVLLSLVYENSLHRYLKQSISGIDGQVEIIVRWQ